MKVHTEFHRLVIEMTDAAALCLANTPTPAEYLERYDAFAKRRQELYEWVGKNTKPPEPLYAVTINF